MKIFLASDHAGFELKQKIGDFLIAKGHEVEDLGPKRFNPADDYPNYIAPCAKKVAANPESMGIIAGMSGQGEAASANRIKGVRAAVFYGGPMDIIKLARQHNDANILSLGARFVSEAEALQAVELFLSTNFSHDERHIRRIQELDNEN